MEVAIPAADRFCAKCQTWRTGAEFTRNRAHPDGVSRYCRACVSVMQKKARSNPSTAANHRDKQRLRSEAMRARLASAKDVPCADCGQRYPSYVMDFDHRDPSQKSFTIAWGCTRRAGQIEAEIAKCDVVCANCHRIRTHNRRGTRGREPVQGVGH